jgi:hypothetical protein
MKSAAVEPLFGAAECDFIRGVQLGVVIGGGDSELQCMLARLDTVQRPLAALEHSGHLAVNVSMYVLADLAFRELELERYGISFDDLSGFRRDNLDAGTLRRLKRGFRRHFI